MNAITELAAIESASRDFREIEFAMLRIDANRALDEVEATTKQMIHLQRAGLFAVDGAEERAEQYSQLEQRLPALTTIARIAIMQRDAFFRTHLAPPADDIAVTNRSIAYERNLAMQDARIYRDGT